MEDRPRGRGFHGNNPRNRAGGHRGGRGHHQEVEQSSQGAQQTHGHRPGHKNWRNRNNTIQENNANDDQLQSGQPRRNYSEQSRRPERTMGFPYVQKLLNNEDMQEVILQLSNDRNGFRNLLDSKEISNDLIVLLVRLLWKVCGSTFQDVKISILSAALQSRFMEKLTLYVTQLISQTQLDKLRNRHFWNDPDNFWNCLINLSKTVQEIIPTNSETIRKLLKTMTIFFPLIGDAHSIHISDDIKARTSSMLDIVEKIVESIEVKRQKLDMDVVLQEDMEPPDDFRQIEIIPSVKEILADISPFLRPNIVDRAFNSINQYLDIQFRLLREDFVAPLRRGINTFLRNQTKPKKDWKKLDDIKVYSPIRFLSVETVNQSHCYRMRFDFSKKKRSFTYENSKRFMFGSLVCFTCDNFQTLHFGKIVQRDIKLLEQGLLIVGFQEQVEINYEIDYLMVESGVYFEPYYQVLGVLKKMDMGTFPMEKYIIRVETDSNPPQYLLKTEPVFYEIEGVRFSPLNDSLEQGFHGLNDSQLSAFKAALSEEFSIIQGPPGTGKTFLGLKIAHTLLIHRHAWYKKTPILVICYTNHALDQFLEGILPLTDNILRVGGQSKNENLKKYNLNDKRRNANNHQAAVHQKRREVRDYVEHIKTLTDTLNQIDLNESVISFGALKKVVEGYEDTWFAQAKQDDVKKWLLEGKTRDREIGRNRDYQQRAIEEMQNMQLADGEENAEDLELENNRDWLDDIFNNIVVLGYRPLITLQQLRDKLNILDSELAKFANQPQDLDSILRQENLQIEIWETETDLAYISNQLNIHGDRRYRRKPRHIDLINPFNMRPEDRWQLYFYWIELYAAQLRRKYEDCGRRFREVFRVYNQLRDVEDTQLMKQHLVVGMTTTGAARLQSSLQALKSPIVIVEEAAEVLEAHIVAALTNDCKHLILIGDHLQLKPGAADYQIGTKFKLGISLFERMVNNNIHCHTLNVQHRMRPEISSLIKPHIYQDLQDHETTLQRAPILGVEKCIYFINHQEQEELCQNSSKKNIHECQFLIALARHLILNGYKPEQITILASYLGQFFEMIREKKKPGNNMLLQDVRISVLDNYQGEESDIILLSLVRSNAENKAGFLRIQNRVCVALSRARDGFYIMGNMSLLLRSNCENHIWDKVKAVLEEQGAIGTHLTLKCQIHPHKFTQVSKGQDFVPLSEGGCNLMCEAQIACGHVCKRLCHVQDRDHGLYKCNEKCTRYLCNDPNHTCKKLCYEECGPCTYLVPRDLECGHRVEIECHIDSNKYKCQVLVSTKLPCDHEANKPCSADPNVFRCPYPCDCRVEPCGHACDRQCHIRMDPDHLQFKCRQACAKPKAGCREAEDKHICTMLCFQECEDCIVGVKKFKSCGHVFTIACKEDVEDVECKKSCKKQLQCGHPCKKKCFESCGPCEVLVNKTISDCQHKVKVKCHTTPTRQNCKSSTCPRLLACGHKCTKPCAAACTETCKEIIDCSIQAPCGHMLTRFQCGLKNTTDAGVLLKHCTERCPVVLKCKHPCSGTCGECMQSRIHKRCAEKCGVPLVCNHECSIPCREACKPCTRPCGMRCKHNKCKKKCGEPCTPCQMPCARRCPHVVCTKACGDICNVLPCTEKCPEQLKCGHDCVGFCGDPCPPLCRTCDKEELTEIFLGSEDEEDAVFVLLNDCKHILEHSGLENWLNDGAYQIQFKTCPKCKTNISTTERYSHFVKAAIKDVISAKIKSYGEAEENEQLRLELLRDLINLGNSCEDNLLAACRKLTEALLTFENRLRHSRNERRQAINQIELNAIKSKLQTVSYIVECFAADERTISRADQSISHLNMLLTVIMRSEDHVSNQEIEDLELEIKRLNRIVQFERIKHSKEYKLAQSHSLVQNLVDKVHAALLVNQRYIDEIDDDVKVGLNDLVTKVDCTVNISDKERMEIVAAMGMAKGHWFKCPNGHPYVIANCGGAQMQSVCHCGASIGGGNYRLAAGNQFAGEMDGASQSAWPNQGSTDIDIGISAYRQLLPIIACFKLEEILYRLETRLTPTRKQRRQAINKIELNAIKSKIQTLQYIIGCFRATNQPYSSTDPTMEHVNMLLKVLLRSEDHVTNQEIQDLELEIDRLNRIVQFDNIKREPEFNFAHHLPAIKTLTENIKDVLFVNKRYTDFLDKAIKTNLEQLVAKINSAVEISDQERMEIVGAMNMAKGHWFKCPNGHPYAIGECGGAMQVAKCFCGAAIGGSNHRLLGSNQLAGEMDNARRHAYPGGLH